MMLNLSKIIETYNWITFKKYDKKNPVSDDAVRVSDINTIVDTANKKPKELEYIWLDQGSEDATDNILRSLLGMYVIGVSDSLKKLWEESDYSANKEDRDTQITFLKAIAEQLYKGSSEEAIQLREACYSEYFRQLILYDRVNNIVYAEDESSKDDKEYGDAINLLDEIMSKLFKEMIIDTDEDSEELVA